MGVSQRRIARYLEITQPMVSRLLRRDVVYYYRELDRVGLSRSLIDHYIEMLSELVVSDQYDKFTITSHMVINILSLRAVCTLKKELSYMCIEGELRDPEIEYYRGLLHKIIAIPGFEKLIPEVGCNFVYAPRHPRGIGDVIGLTGRIMRTSTGLAIYGVPMYGGSRHLARVLCIVARYNPSAKYAVNIKNFNDIPNQLRRMGLSVLETGPHRSMDEFWRSIETTAVNKPDAICDQGGMGLEPVTYIFASSPSRLLEILSEIRVN
jgi:predicted fused transcriptional regulator/phosphomethylpyrimidine kinase/predicted transcriptional regulator